MDNNMIEIINELCNKFGIVFDYTSSTIQTLIGKYARYNICCNILLLFLSIVLIIVGIAFIYNAFHNKRFCNDTDSYSGDIRIVIFCAGFLALLFGAMALISSINTLIKATTIPELLFYQLLTK